MRNVAPIVVVAAGIAIGWTARGIVAQPIGPSDLRAEVIGSGARRVYRDERVRLSQAQLQELLDAKKAPAGLDVARGEWLRRTFSDHLPGDWILERPDGLTDDVRTDSLGNVIVNDTPGLPAWSQPDVDALLDAIAQARDDLRLDRAARRDDTESAGILANFLGQALSRGINADQVVDLDDPAIVDPFVARGVLDYLHYYENIRFANQALFNYVYAPSSYPPRVRDFAIRHGQTLGAIQAIEPMQEFEPRGGQPSGCYTRTAFARGMTNLSGQTDIWVANGFDDESADIPTGFPIFFSYDCQDPDNNDMIRVSTNGYISFFQQGNGALDGIDFSNDTIPNATDPDGFAAPWWDDLIVNTNQGTADRVSYKTEGAIDQRVFTVEWFSVSRLGGSTTEFHFFQVKLYETSDIVELHISTDWATDTADDATTGIENYTGAGGECGPNCLNTNNPPPPNNYRFTPAPRPDNDNCAAAIELVNGASVQGNLHRATPDGTASCGSSNNNRDVWYTFVARCNGTLHADTCGSRDLGGAGMGSDTVLSIHSACPGTASNQLACSDDAGAAGCAGVDSAVSVAMVANQRVFIRVTHFGDAAFRLASGDFKLNLNFVSSTPPANDNCAAAQVLLSGNTAIGNLLCASNDGSSDCGSSATNPDIWYRFSAPFAGRLTVDLCGSRNNAGVDSGPDTVVSIHSACPGTIANQLACDDDGFTPGC
ncbi:MAG: hypothetical protein AB7G11_12380, partial [Phycisphaerales bacterium]